ncbi:ATP-grasp domain-containing protein [Paenibacillus piscarius]|uniref:ATP-grasp domain-containing protein n=1 Tax=Paenibacillus piscarius TaxID=1089681 RepID=UPI001EE90B3D|nr:ATP-grasp domain-containing protein [Paenibacillus piscarius]
MITEPRNILITGGRAPVALELARLFKAAGHRVYAAESAVYHLCRVSSAVTASFRVPSPRHQPQAYVQRLAALAAELGIDLLVPTCEEIFYIAAGLDQFTGCRVLAPERRVLAGLHHKGEFIAMARSFGLAVPDTELLSSASEWQRAVERAAADGRQQVYKPAYSRFASQVILPGMAATPPAGISAASPWVSQEYIRGTALCTYSVVYEGTVVAHAAYGSRYRTGRSGASVYFAPLEHPEALEWVRRFSGASGFSGQISFDFIEADNGTLYPIECNPRATSGIHLFSPEDGLTDALLSPGRLAQSGELVRPRSSRTAMLTLPMLGCGLKPGQGGRRDWGQAWLGAADVIWRKGDLLPVLEQLLVVYAAIRTARKHRISLTEALTEDIEWNGEA